MSIKSGFETFISKIIVLRRIQVIKLIVLAALVASADSIATAQTTEQVSVDSFGNQGDSSSSYHAISADGRFVAFTSAASNLVEGDTNDAEDVFVHDRQTGVTERVSVDSFGNEGNEQSFLPAISGDGRFVAFASWASNLVEGDTNGAQDVFVHDRQIGVTERVSGGTYPSISADGRFVAFMRFAFMSGGVQDIWVYDRQTSVTERVDNQGNDHSWYVAISADGRFVAFMSRASNLVEGDTNGAQDVFVHDRQTGATERVSVDSLGNEGSGSARPSISGDGRFVAFDSYASNLVDADTNGVDDVFVHDRQTGVTERVSISSLGDQGNNSSIRPSSARTGASWRSTHMPATWWTQIPTMPRMSSSTTAVRSCMPSMAFSSRWIISLFLMMLRRAVLFR